MKSITTLEYDPKKAIYQPERHISDKVAKEQRIKIHNHIEDEIKNVNEIFRPFYNYNPNYIEEIQSNFPKIDGIYLGKHWKFKKEVGLKIKRLAADVMISGPSDCGKTVALHNIFIYNTFLRTPSICGIYFDYKSEAQTSLSYQKDGKTYSFLKNKIINVSKYEKGMLLDLMGKDRVIIINLALVKKDQIAFRQTILDVMEDIHTRIEEFNEKFVKTDNIGKITAVKIPYKILLIFEEAYTIFPKHHHTNDTWKAFQSKARALYSEQKQYLDRADRNSQKKDYDSAEHWYEQAKQIPNLYEIQNRIEELANENAKTNRHLGIGSIYSTQRISDMNPNLTSQCNTQVVLGANIKSDEDILKTEKIDKTLLKEFLEIPRYSAIRYMLVSTKDFRAIIEKPPIVLYHKSSNVREEKRKENIEVNYIS